MTVDSNSSTKAAGKWPARPQWDSGGSFGWTNGPTEPGDAQDDPYLDFSRPIARPAHLVA
jgi:hypothetical protein